MAEGTEDNSNLSPADEGSASSSNQDGESAMILSMVANKLVNSLLMGTDDEDDDDATDNFACFDAFQEQEDDISFKIHGQPNFLNYKNHHHHEVISDSESVESAMEEMHTLAESIFESVTSSLSRPSFGGGKLRKIVGESLDGEDEIISEKGDTTASSTTFPESQSFLSKEEAYVDVLDGEDEKHSVDIDAVVCVDQPAKKDFDAMFDIDKIVSGLDDVAEGCDAPRADVDQIVKGLLKVLAPGGPVGGGFGASNLERKQRNQSPSSAWPKKRDAHVFYDGDDEDEGEEDDGEDNFDYLDDECSVLSDLSGLSSVFPRDPHAPRHKKEKTKVEVYVQPPEVPVSKKPVPATLIPVPEKQKKKKTEKHSVKFDVVLQREYERIITSNPACKEGPAIGIGWEHTFTRVYQIDKYEKKRTQRRKEKGYRLFLSKDDRMKMLRGLGYTEKEIAASVREKNRLRRQRLRTATNFNAARMEELAEGFVKGIKQSFLSPGKFRGFRDKSHPYQPIHI